MVQMLLGDRCDGGDVLKFLSDCFHFLIEIGNEVISWEKTWGRRSYEFKETGEGMQYLTRRGQINGQGRWIMIVRQH